MQNMALVPPDDGGGSLSPVLLDLVDGHGRRRIRENQRLRTHRGRVGYAVCWKGVGQSGPRFSAEATGADRMGFRGEREQGWRAPEARTLDQQLFSACTCACACACTYACATFRMTFGETSKREKNVVFRYGVLLCCVLCDVCKKRMEE